MRILYHGDFRKPWSTESYVGRALERAGCTVDRWQEVPSPVVPAGDWDVFLFSKGRCGGGSWKEDGPRRLLAMVEGRVQRTVCWQWDLLNPAYSLQRFIWADRVSAMVDYFFTTDGSLTTARKDWHLLRQGIGDDVRPGVAREDYACDVLFLGDAYKGRGSWVSGLAARYGRRFWHANGFRGDVLNDVLASCRVFVCPPWPAYSGYWSNRLYIGTGYGAFTVHPWVDGLCDDGFCSLTRYMTESDCIPAIDHALGLSEGEREKRRGETRDHCREHCSYDSRVKRLLEVVT